MNVKNKVVLQDLEDEVVREEYHILPNTTTTICVLHGKTGWAATGISACADPSNFDVMVGRKWAREDALKKFWPLLGFRLKDKLSLIGKAGAPTGKILSLGSPVTYVGTKVVHAVAMSRGDYNIYRGWKLPDNENGDDNGYLIEYADGGAGNIEGHPGYVSWSPQAVFEKSYDTGERYEPVVDTFLTRLKAELAELEDKFNKLNAFLNSAAIKTLLTGEADDLLDQAMIMHNYMAVLSRRISRNSK